MARLILWLKCRVSQNHLGPPCQPITNTVSYFPCWRPVYIYIRSLWLRSFLVSDVSPRTACASAKKALTIWLLCHKCQWVTTTALAETQGVDAGHLGQGMRTEPWTHRLPAGHAVIWWQLIMMLPTIETGLVENLKCACCHGNAGCLCQASSPEIDNWFMDWLIFILCVNKNKTSYSRASSPMRL